VSELGAEEKYEQEGANEALEFVDLINKLGEDFDRLCQDRHRMGQKEYGEFTFLENDVVRMMVEELADTANYARMQAIKLMLLQGAVEQNLQAQGIGADEEEIKIGVKAFKGVGEVGWTRP
jgi:hypothetical protein